MFYPEATTCDACGKKAKGVHECNIVHVVDHQRLRGRREALALTRTIDIVFDGPCGHESGRFIEVEQDGKSIRVGEWVDRKDGTWALRIPNVG